MSRSYVTYRFIEAIFIDLFQAWQRFSRYFQRLPIYLLSLACLLKMQKLKNSNSSYPLATSVLARTERDSVYEFCSFLQTNMFFIMKISRLRNVPRWWASFQYVDVSERWCIQWKTEAGILGKKELRVLPIAVERTTFRIVQRMLYHWTILDSWRSRPFN